MALAFSQTYKVIRNNVGGTWSNGLYTKGATTEISIEGSVQPVNGEDLLNLPEAQRSKGVLKIFTDVKLYTVSTKNNFMADILEYKGDKYEVQEVKDYSDYFFSHYRAILTKVEDNIEKRKLN